MSKINYGRPQFRLQGRPNDIAEKEAEARKKDLAKFVAKIERRNAIINTAKNQQRLVFKSTFEEIDPRNPYHQLRGVDLTRPPWD